MSYATRIKGLASIAGRLVTRMTHGSLMVAALAAVLGIGAHYVQAEARDARMARAEAESADKTVLSKAQQEAEDALLSSEMVRVRDWVAKRYRVSGQALEPALVEAEQSAREAALDPLLIVAMIAVESSFNPLAKSHAGALGLMQVIPRWHMDKIGEDNDHKALFDPRFNVQVGTLVLVEGLQRYGSLEAALQYYNGARHDPEMRYAKRVLAMKQRLQGAAARSSGA